MTIHRVVFKLYPDKKCRTGLVVLARANIGKLLRNTCRLGGLGLSLLRRVAAQPRRRRRSEPGDAPHEQQTPAAPAAAAALFVPPLLVIHERDRAAQMLALLPIRVDYKRQSEICVGLHVILRCICV